MSEPDVAKTWTDAVPKANGDKPARRKGRLVSNVTTTQIGAEPANDEDIAEWMRRMKDMPGIATVVPDGFEVQEVPEDVEATEAISEQEAFVSYMDGLRGALAQEVVLTVNHARQAAYGPPEAGMAVVANLWTAYTEQELLPQDVVAMLALLKVGRLQANPFHLDSWKDLMGYALIGAGLAAINAEIPEDTGEDMGQ